MFAVASTTSVTEVVTRTTTFTLPSYSDSDGDSITLTTYETSTSALPSFVTFASPSTYTIAPTTTAESGSYSIDAQICDGQPLCSTFTFTISVVVNHAPVFSSTVTTVVTVNL